MYFFPALFSSAAFIVPISALSSSLIDVTKYAGKTNGGYIVMFKSKNAAQSFANESNMVTDCFDIIDACAGKFNDQCIQELRANPNVEGIYEDGVGHLNAAPEWPKPAIHSKYVNIRTNATWGLARMSSQVKLKYTNATSTDFKFYYDPKAGQGSDIYIIDTGVYVEHADFGGRARWGPTFHGEPHVDKAGHGTFCAGLAAGATYGVAKKANIIAVKVMESNGTGSASATLHALDYVRKQALHSGHPSVVSFSIGFKAFKPLDDAVDKVDFFALLYTLHSKQKTNLCLFQLADYEIPVVVAAGNEGEEASLHSPGRAYNAITIAASDILDQRTVKTNYGPAVYMFAPGKKITSTYIGHEHAITINSGTSASAPYVAGIVATFQIYYGKLSIEKMKFALHNASLLGVLHKAFMTPNRLAQNGFSQIEEQKYFDFDQP
ncbi:hypothetical protein C0995_003180 [Termitomyces sp. Mi166|nr:hypothetical protein C0995_003180 [Termitomyces sp. Mi166\